MLEQSLKAESLKDVKAWFVSVDSPPSPQSE